jgi:hypothetical protein
MTVDHTLPRYPFTAIFFNHTRFIAPSNPDTELSEVTIMAKGTFVTAINCMDGRTQEPVNVWMRENFGADFVDTITEAGPDGILANGPYRTIGAIIDRVRISVNMHGSQVVAVVAHTKCAGNPVTKKEHMEHLGLAVREVSSWAGDVRVIGLWVNSKWEVELIYDTVDESEG